MPEEQKRTSLEFSKWLKENGCKLESKYVWCSQGHNYLLLEYDKDDNVNEQIPAYDILNDICVTHAKKFLGLLFVVKRQRIFELMCNNEKEKAEEYIKEHCSFNLENK